MEFDLRTSLVVIGVVIIAIIAWDGWRRSRKEDDASLVPDLDSEKHYKKRAEPELSYTDDDGFDNDGIGAVRVVASAEDDFEVEDMPSVSARQVDDVKIPDAPEEVIAINILAPEGDVFAGEGLLHHFLLNGLKYSKLGIFHRYENSDGSGEVLFNLANAVKPGIFNIDDTESMDTPGLCLFLTLPGPSNPIQAFDVMLETAERLSKDLCGSLLDAQRSVLTHQTKQHYRERITEYQRKHLSTLRKQG